MEETSDITIKTEVYDAERKGEEIDGEEGAEVKEDEEEEDEEEEEDFRRRRQENRIKYSQICREKIGDKFAAIPRRDLETQPKGGAAEKTTHRKSDNFESGKSTRMKMNRLKNIHVIAIFQI